MNKKGQALVEFILIIPIIVILLLAAFDWVRILQSKTEMEDMLDTYINENIEDNSYTYTTTKEDNYNVYTINSNIEIYSPVLVPVLGSKYNIEVERKIYAKS